MNYGNPLLNNPLLAGRVRTLLPLAIAGIAAGASALATGAGAAINAKTARKAHQKADRAIGALSAENTSDYYTDYYRSALDNDSARAYLKRLDKSLAKSNRTLDNSIVSSGATAENALAAKEARGSVVSDAMANLVAQEDNRRQGVRQNYLNRKTNLTSQQIANDQRYAAQKQQNTSQMVGAIANAASSVGTAFMSGLGNASNVTASAAEGTTDITKQKGLLQAPSYLPNWYKPSS